jgi:probable F420-dependent oxidoreductase
MKVRIGLAVGGQSAGPVVSERFATMVDGLEHHGFDSLWVPERVNSGALDPLVALAFAAGRTRRLKLGTSVLVVPGRNPVLLAKALASLDRLSDGRLLPGFGLGAVNPAEQQAFGVAREERSSWFDEAVPLIRRLWAEDAVDHDGPRFRFTGLRVGPKPVQTPPEIWLGGMTLGELRRVGRLGEGWLPSFMTPAEVAEGRLVVERAAEAAGRTIDPEHYGALVQYSRAPVSDRHAELIAHRRRHLDPVDPREIVPAGPAALRAQLERFVERGVSKFVVLPIPEPASWPGELDELAAAVLPLQRATPDAA